MKKSKQRSWKVLLFSDLFMLMCVILLMYPLLADVWNSAHNSRLFSGYVEEVQSIETEKFDDIKEEAEQYNRELLGRGFSRFIFSQEDTVHYQELLRLPSTDVMAYLSIDKLGIRYMPIYHTTTQVVLQAGVGHFEGSSLPIGGVGTHSALSGHTGMTGNRMFSELGRMDIGDTFQIDVLGETLTYRIDQIEKVLPDDLSLLEIEPEKDLCTLITCTPIGINSHRLLVRGYRIENPEEMQAEAELIKINIFQRAWEYMAARFAVYELIMALGGILVFALFLLPDLIRLILIPARRRAEEKQKEPKEKEDAGEIQTEQSDQTDQTDQTDHVN